MIRLHASSSRSVVVGGADLEAVTSDVQQSLGAVLADPPGLLLTTSCSAALGAAATLLDLRPGDEVVVPAFEFPTAATAFSDRGASVRFADVDARTANMDPAALGRVLGPRTKAVVVLHYAGVGADLDAIAALTEPLGVSIIEDVAHGPFAELDGVALGRRGRFGCFSFHRTKNLSAIDGGALVVNDPADLARAEVAVDKGTNRAAFERGEVSEYEWSGPGAGSRMGEVSLRLLAPELNAAAARQQRRHEIWARYRSELNDAAEFAGARLPFVPEGRRHPAHLFHVVLADAEHRPRFVAACAAAGVETARHLGSLPASTFGREIADPRDECPVAEDLAARLVRLPLHHDVSDAQVDHVIETTVAALGGP